MLVRGGGVTIGDEVDGVNMLNEDDIGDFIADKADSWKMVSAKVIQSRNCSWIKMFSFQSELETEEDSKIWELEIELVMAWVAEENPLGISHLW